MKHVDKNSLKHLAVCLLISLAGLYGVTCAVGAALTKEWCDRQSYGHWCWMDLLFDGLGCGIGYVIHCLVFGW